MSGAASIDIAIPLRLPEEPGGGRIGWSVAGDVEGGAHLDRPLWRVDGDFPFLFSPVSFTPGEVSQVSPLKITDKDVFGPRSTLATQTKPATANPSTAQGLIDNTGFQLSVLLLLVLYASLVFAFKQCLDPLAKAVRFGGNPEKAFGDQTLLFKHFLGYSSLLSMLTATVLITRAADIFFPGDFEESVTGLPVVIMPLLIFTGVFVVFLYKRFMFGAMRFLSGNADFFDTHLFMGQVMTSAGMLVVTPLAILSAVDGGAAAEFLSEAALVLCTVAYLVFLWRSLLFFTSRGVFILQWILYLCAVEIFPVSLFILLLSGN